MTFLDTLRERLFGGTLLFELRRGGFGALADLPAEFCNTGDEWHSLALGVMTPFDREPMDANQIPESYPDEVRAMILGEYWYYRFGRVVGRVALALLGLALGVKFGGWFM